MMKASNHTLLDRSPPGSTRTKRLPPYTKTEMYIKHATGASLKIRGRDSITIGTWNTRTPTDAGKLEELTHEMVRYG